MNIPSYSDICKTDSSLRPYQQKAKREIFEAWDEVDNVMFQMPTGTGKTRLFTSIISDINKYSIQRREAVKILIIAHRTELIEQISDSLRRYQVAHHIIAGGREKNYYAPVIVASIQTITNTHNIEDAKKLKVQFIIIDEAHHSLAASYKKLWKMYPNAKRLGVTATPWRMNHQTFLELFDKLVMSMPIKDFIKQGFLSPYKYFSLKNDTSIQRTIDDIELDRFGEYKESSMEEKMDIGSIRAQLLDSYLSLAKGKKGIIYAINIVHAKHICEEYKAAGYNVVSIDSKTPAAERKELVGNFKRGLIDIIVNVDIFSEGFDCPDIEFIQLARPTRSLVKYLQQVGRGLRITEDKTHCIILDNVGMYSRFGLPDARRHWKYHFIGKDVDEEPKRLLLGGGGGGQRYVDMSEGTEDMELIQDDYKDIEPIGGVSSSVDEFFPLFGVTLGQTTWKDAEDLGAEVEIWKKGPDRFCHIKDVAFWDHDGEGAFTSLYWTVTDEEDFPHSWKSKGFSWELSYDEWITVFKDLGFEITIIYPPSQVECHGMSVLHAVFEALSSDGMLEFSLDFDFGENGCLTSSPDTLYSISVNYCESSIENKVDVPEVNEVEEDNDYNPIPELLENNYVNDNIVFWSDDNKNIYEAYIQDDRFFIISELIIDKVNHCVHRNRVGKIPMSSWMFWQMERWKVDNLKSIIHYGANYTVFHYQVLDKNNEIKDKYFDYKGNEIGTPLLVDAKFERGKRERQIKDFIDIPVSKATFELKTTANNINILRTVKGNTRSIAIFPTQSDFGKHCKLYTYDFYWSDSNSFTIKCVVEEVAYLFKYDLQGKLIKRGTFAKLIGKKKASLEDKDIEKLWRVFDKKATSYKYFWFLSIMQLFNETNDETITYRQLIVRMISNAWDYVHLMNGEFSMSDQIPVYVITIQRFTKMPISSSKSHVEKEVDKLYGILRSTTLAPLLKNVPYRFLSPWIPFTNNADVTEQSARPEVRSLYTLQEDSIVINEVWKDYLAENYKMIVSFIEKELASYLKIKQDTDLYTVKFPSLSRLLKEIKTINFLKISKPILERFNLPLNQKITPADIINRIPESNWTVDKDGNKTLDVPDGEWTLKRLVELLSN